MSYKLSIGGVIRLSDSAFIPESKGNSDWVEYQRWLSMGNTPDDSLLVNLEQEVVQEAQKREIARVARQAIRNAVDNPPNTIADVRRLIFDLARALNIINGN